MSAGISISAGRGWVKLTVVDGYGHQIGGGLTPQQARDIAGGLQKAADAAGDTDTMIQVAHTMPIKIK